MSSFLQSSKMFKSFSCIVEVLNRLPCIVGIRVSLPFYKKLRAVIPFSLCNYSFNFVFFDIVNYVWWWWQWSREGVRRGIRFEERYMKCRVYTHCCREIEFVCDRGYF